VDSVTPSDGAVIKMMVDRGDLQFEVGSRGGFVGRKLGHTKVKWPLMA
jgi:hypothetical protein